MNLIQFFFLRRYPVKRHTIHLNIPYFVKEKFDSEYQGSLGRLENSVEEEFITFMKQSCYRERSYRKYLSLHVFCLRDIRNISNKFKILLFM